MDQAVSCRLMAVDVWVQVPVQSIWDLGAGFLLMLWLFRVTVIPSIIMLPVHLLPPLHIHRRGECR